MGKVSTKKCPKSVIDKSVLLNVGNVKVGNFKRVQRGNSEVWYAWAQSEILVRRRKRTRSIMLMI